MPHTLNYSDKLAHLACLTSKNRKKVASCTAKTWKKVANQMANMWKKVVNLQTYNRK